MIALGLTGTNNAGKGEVAKYLISKGFVYYSCSDELRKEAKKMGLPETREILGHKIGDDLRRRFGKGILGKRIYEEIQKNKNNLVIIDSLRNLEEVNELRKLKNFNLIFVDAPVELRYKRALERKRITDHISLEEFKRVEEKEEKGINTLMKMEDCYKNADFKIINDSDLKTLYKKIEEILEKTHFKL